MEYYHLFVGKPQCAYVDEIYVSDNHLHKETELVFVASGTLLILAGKQEYLIHAGELFCIQGNVLHQYIPRDDNAVIIKIKFMAEWLMPTYFLTEEQEKLTQLYSQLFRTRDDENIRRIVMEMSDCPLPSYSDYYYLGKMIELTAYLLSHPESICKSVVVMQDNMRYMDQANRFIQEHCYEKLTLKMLADHLGLTETYCSKYIKKNTGIAFVAYVNAVRVNNAQRLLLNTDCSVIEIVERTGFSSVQTFSRVFKELSGTTPTAYRNRKRKASGK